MRRVNLREWERALQAEDLSQDNYLGERRLEEQLPWDSVTTGVSKAFFTWDLRRAIRDELTDACPPAGCLKCNACDETWAFRPDFQQVLGPNMGAYGDNFIPLQS